MLSSTACGSGSACIGWRGLESEAQREAAPFLCRRLGLPDKLCMRPAIMVRRRCWPKRMRTGGARTGHAILERYGMTETNMNGSNPWDGPRKPETVGLPLPGVDIRIADPDTGAPIPKGEIGGIEVRGPNVFSGYWQMPEKTAAEFRKSGFFITGDLGRFDEDGYLTIVGRSKDLIITCNPSGCFSPTVCRATRWARRKRMSCGTGASGCLHRTRKTTTGRPRRPAAPAEFRNFRHDFFRAGRRVRRLDGRVWPAARVYSTASLKLSFDDGSPLTS